MPGEIGFHLPAEALATYKVIVLDKMAQGYDVAEVPCELLIALIERTEAWMRLEADAAQFQKEAADGNPA